MHNSSLKREGTRSCPQNTQNTILCKIILALLAEAGLVMYFKAFKTVAAHFTPFKKRLKTAMLVRGSNYLYLCAPCGALLHRKD